MIQIMDPEEEQSLPPIEVAEAWVVDALLEVSLGLGLQHRCEQALSIGLMEVPPLLAGSGGDSSVMTSSGVEVGSRPATISEIAWPKRSLVMTM